MGHGIGVYRHQSWTCPVVPVIAHCACAVYGRLADQNLGCPTFIARSLKFSQDETMVEHCLGRAPLDF